MFFVIHSGPVFVPPYIWHCILNSFLEIAHFTCSITAILDYLSQFAVSTALVNNLQLIYRVR